jgi:hypothetical protein
MQSLCSLRYSSTKRVESDGCFAHPANLTRVRTFLINFLYALRAPEIEREEKKVAMSIKECAKRNDIASAKVKGSLQSVDGHCVYAYVIFLYATYPVTLSFRNPHSSL